MFQKILDELDWYAKILILAAAAFFSLDCTLRAEDGWSKGTDGYYYKNGDSSAPYEAVAYTVWERVKYCDDYGCCYWKNVAVKKWKYTRVYKITEKTSLDEIALYMAGIKGKEIESELRTREDRAKVLRIQELASIYGFDTYKLQKFGQFLDYGDSEYQFPPQVGDTRYGTRVVHAETYGDTRLPLVEAMAMQKELQLVTKQYAHESDVAWQSHSAEIIDNEGERITKERQLNAQNETIGVLSDTLLEALKITKPSGSRLKIEESEYGREERQPPRKGATTFNQQVDPDDVWLALTKTSCAACHDRHAEISNENFPNGLNPADLSEMIDHQLEAVSLYIGGSHCPPKDNALGVPELTTRQRKWAVNYLASLHKGD